MPDKLRDHGSFIYLFLSKHFVNGNILYVNKSIMFTNKNILFENKTLYVGLKVHFYFNHESILHIKLFIRKYA